MRYKFTFIVFVLTPLTLKECLKSPISSICFLFTVKNWKKSSISFNCFNSPLIVSFHPFLSRFWGPENDTISGVDSIYNILIDFSSQISSQITDFFRSQKYFLLRHANFWFVPYRSRDNFRKNDDLFPIGAFPIGAEDCSLIYFLV